MDGTSLQADSLVLPEPDEMQPTATETSHCAQHQQARLNRVTDFQVEAIAKPDALESNLASLSCGMMRVGIRLDEFIEQAMTCGPTTIERMQRILPAIETCVRNARQVERFAMLAARIAKERQPKATSIDANSLQSNAVHELAQSQSEENAS